jgi:hypothetical protein
MYVEYLKRLSSEYFTRSMLSSLTSPTGWTSRILLAYIIHPCYLCKRPIRTCRCVITINTTTLIGYTHTMYIPVPLKLRKSQNLLPPPPPIKIPVYVLTWSFVNFGIRGSFSFFCLLCICFNIRWKCFPCCNRNPINVYNIYCIVCR